MHSTGRWLWTNVRFPFKSHEWQELTESTRNQAMSYMVVIGALKFGTCTQPSVQGSFFGLPPCRFETLCTCPSLCRDPTLWWCLALLLFSISPLFVFVFEENYLPLVADACSADVSWDPTKFVVVSRLFIYVCKTKKTGFVHMRYAIYFFRDGISCVLSREYPGKCSP